MVQVTPVSASEFSGLNVARGRSDGADLARTADEQGGLVGILAQLDTVDAGFQGTPEQYTNWIAQQLQAMHDDVYTRSSLQAVNDPDGDLRKVDSTEKVIISGNSPNDTVTYRSIVYSVTWNGSEYVVGQRRL